MMMVMVVMIMFFWEAEGGLVFGVEPERDIVSIFLS